MKHYRFIISGGGTGGHIFPALAIANGLKERFPKAQFLFVGAKDRMEMEKVPLAGFAIEGLWISGLQRSLSFRNLLFPIKLISSMIRSRKIIRKFKPDAAIGTGGYASAPLLRVASGKKIPSLIQEQNSHAGITNKWLAHRVDRICVAYEGMDKYFPTEKIVHTGNPVRKELVDIRVDKQTALQHFGLTEGKKTVLILGGSLGAFAINDLIANNLEFFRSNNLQLVWQCGANYIDTYKENTNEHIKVHAFLSQMDMAYSAADFIISRAGALSVSELCLVGKPVVFIPSPNVAEDHQTKNAQAIVNKEAAVMVIESDLSEKFIQIFSELVSSEERQLRLSENIKRLAKPNATSAIVKEVEQLIEADSYND